MNLRKEINQVLTCKMVNPVFSTDILSTGFKRALPPSMSELFKDLEYISIDFSTYKNAIFEA